MLKRYAKLAISSAYFVLLSAKRITQPDRRPPLIVLYYHGVPASRRQRFAAQLAILSRIARVVPPDWAGSGEARQLLVAITFDDALTSVFDNALPELKRYGFPSIIFVPTGKLDRCPDWEMEDSTDKTDPVVDRDRLRSMTSSFASAGSHGVNHVHMTQVPLDVARAEIRESRAELERLTGQPVSSFSFPYGDWNEDLVSICREEGIDNIFLISPDPVHLAATPSVRGRVAVTPDDLTIEFLLKVSGAYAWMAHISRWKNRFKRYRFLSGSGSTKARPLRFSRPE